MGEVERGGRERMVDVKPGTRRTISFWMSMNSLSLGDGDSPVSGCQNLLWCKGQGREHNIVNVTVHREEDKFDLVR